MKNLTVSLPESVLEKLKEVAAKRRTSLNKLVRETLSALVGEGEDVWESEHGRIAERVKGYKSEGPTTREELYADRTS